MLWLLWVVVVVLPAKLWWLRVKRERRRGTGEIGSEEGEGRDWVLHLLGLRKFYVAWNFFFLVYLFF